MRILILLMLAIITSQAEARKLQLYECPTEQDATTCGNQCKNYPDEKLQVDFNVNESNSLVMLTFFSNGNQSGVVIVENCKIINSKNWLCNDQYKDLTGAIITKRISLSSDRFTLIYTGAKDGKTDFYRCGK